MKIKIQNPFALKTLAAFALLASLLLTGCVVTSIYPFYNAKDLTFEPGLLGTWCDATNSNEKETWTFEKIDDDTYKFLIADADKKSEFDAHLFKLEGRLFMDCLSRERPDNAAPVHFLMQLTSLTPNLEVKLLDYDWLSKLLVANPRALRHTIVPKKAGAGDGGDIVLTADTAELQKFIRKHLKTQEAWAGESGLRKK